MIVKTSKGDLPVKYGMSALAKFGDMTGRNMNEVMESLQDFGKLSINDLLAFVYVGFVDGARQAKQECAIENPDEVGDLIDEDEGLISKMIVLFAGEGEEGEEGKKK
jgi:hypothetical protein